MSLLLSKFQTSVLLGGVLLVVAIPASANLVVNGSFEGPIASSYNGFPGSGSSYNYIAVNCNYALGISSEGVTPVCGPVTVDNWAYVNTPTNPPYNSGGAGVAANGSAFGNTAAPDGNQVLFLQNQSSAAQTIGGIQAGDTYTISFYAEQRSWGSPQTLDVTLGNQTLFSGTAPSSNAFTLETGSIVADQSGSLALTLAGRTGQYGSDATIFVDDVNLTLSSSSANVNFTSATPEPGFYGLLALGLSGFATVLGRRKKARKTI
jgi:hypothetical protein